MNQIEKIYFPSRSKNDTTSTGVLFEARSFYKKYSVPFAIEQNSNVVVDDEAFGVFANSPSGLKSNFIPTSDLYNENSLYGIVDHEGDVIIPYRNLKNFISVGIDENNDVIYLQDFVADAFNDMTKYLNEQILGNCVSLSSIPAEIMNSPFFNISVKKAYSKPTDIEDLYLGNSIVIASKFRALTLTDKELDSQITDSTSFTKKYIEFLKQHLLISPVTKSRTACFYNLRTFSNGLTFSISNDDAGDDENKYEKYLIDKAFHNFAKACIRFGFRIDKNNPFILHVDLESPAMAPYYNKYSLKNSRDIFKKRYKKVFTEDLESLKKFFVDSYNSYLYNNTFYYPNVNNLCSKKVKDISVKIREPIENSQQLEEYYKLHPDYFWMRLYIYFKSLELQVDIEQKSFEEFVEKANNYIKFGKIDLALKFVNSKFNEMSGVHYFSSLLQKNGMVNSVPKTKKNLIF